jgi:hypothetical protein
MLSSIKYEWDLNRLLSRLTPVAPRISVITPVRNEWLIGKDRIEGIGGRCRVIEIFAPRIHLQPWSVC